ncbi:MMPL family transporter [Boudabousia marimammalium]|uniref:SSD domain-containing protein n=1 Tax=Boudabousia marimammalium TaxID=156892 RepID=A0A1Q5PRR2_9ACTO|nr:MMPL family transporter [Boudabousia marimammalium]OKL50278.1 hypothetical protein BM477_02500 [Boudabousia marimammalium]
MSASLHQLGRLCVRRAKTVLTVWLAILITLFVGVASVGLNLDDSFTLENSESIAGMNILQEQLPQASGTNGQIVYESIDGKPITDHRDQILEFVEKSSKIKGVTYVANPFDSPDLWVSLNGKFAISQAQIADFTDAATAGPGMHENAKALDGVKVHLSKELTEVPGVLLSITEAFGVLLAMLILFLTFRSVVAAGLPIVSALIGVGAGMAGILLIAAFTDVSSTAPTLAVMLGLAVGIDYSLLILSRHRDHLAEGLSVEEAAGRALATSGSAVIFAGTTVIIALLGMFVVDIGFLTVMGVVSAMTVAFAVLVAITAIPAFAGLVGARLTPKPQKQSKAGQNRPTHPVADKWSNFIIRKPWLAIAGAVIIAALLTMPVTALGLALPDASFDPKDSEGRQTYELIAKEFGEGYNSPIVVIGDLITSTTPVEDAERLGDELKKIPGVEKVAIATIDQKASIAFAQLIPKHSQSDPRTTDLVNQIRNQRQNLEDTTQVSNLKVTGLTAVAIDISSSLSQAFLPFGLVVVGLSLILLMIVFRSVAVPITATLGYLISLASAMGVTGAVFGWGWGADLLNVTRTGPVISFMPIIVMGVLFGLAMDYQVFLVSRMREAHVRGADTDGTIREAFRGAGKVVTAAALIMFGVFAFFIPEGGVYVRPMAVALTVGIAVDAFLVRMTLIPALMKLLGERAWWLPAWLDRLLPQVDIEGEGLARAIDNDEWHLQHPDIVVRAENLSIKDEVSQIFSHYSFTAGEGINIIVEPDALRRAALTAALQGRLAVTAGLLSVLGQVLPDRESAVGMQTAEWEASSARRLQKAQLVVANQPPEQFWTELKAFPPRETGQTVMVLLADQSLAPVEIWDQATLIQPIESPLESPLTQGESQ